ncbi:squalene synthase HpnC, partial [Streptomyces chartreusis]
LRGGFGGGGGAALAATAAAEYDVLPGPPKASKLRLLREVGVTLRGEG